jgi:hypothetical protein
MMVKRHHKVTYNIKLTNSLQSNLVNLKGREIYNGCNWLKLQSRVKLIFLYSHSGVWSPNWVHVAHRPPIGLFYLPRVTVRIEDLVVERRLAGETEVLGANLP